ncbi:MAG: YifB family Mg chelatase-like AAA ATPase [Candidatus Marinimicrobia bacterium]|nr:YifB family Mg chelatase-like AAA ATPase [Candidatus Neomarinimicrobiota bacterium]MBT3501280.1 YifB family Mg chelatase-like AAA ATPase [Candidatus Neomarinimicrobiota bacterium]MBT3839184.1 YifB family Mg chelatase-like AAA ATPase [Candidatus Neomarinimicrobiota bacterium]MBT3999057.1 YifB family Mg chelatase-like AAA ATPase [Candidatus Neomarinimicrobiota bacterium]MBT4283113.1 YifB family Mg chelatase-like AAA ATPase [Candidatus Neomarinimicrobiota bacterium]
MNSKVLSSAILGIDAYIVEVECHMTGARLPKFVTVGLPEGAVKESKERVKAAIRNSGYKLPGKRITINLAPADIRKEGSTFDLPIAVGLLAAMGIVNDTFLDKLLLMGELALDGTIRPIQGALPIAICAKKNHIPGIIVPEENAREASVVDGVKVAGASSLSEVVQILNGTLEKQAIKTDLDSYFKQNSNYPRDFSDVKGQEQVKRALEVAAAGGHNVIMVGPPGSGKTMLAKRIPTILPNLTLDEALETTKIHSVAGILHDKHGLVGIRPFRSPHHTISDAGLIGGGAIPKPGEVSLAHHGVLFLDELPEFKKNVLEVMRQPLEDGVVTIARAALTLTYPAQFMLVAAMNPCPCGYATDPKNECACSSQMIQRYMSRISGPLMDRIDIHIEVPTVPFQELADKNEGESSKHIQKRVQKAREIQLNRFTISNCLYANAQMESQDLKKYCRLDQESNELLRTAMDKLGLSARAYDRILKVSRTIADLEKTEKINSGHISEAIQYRSLDRQLWLG